MATEALEAEVERLRAEVQSYRDRELAQLRDQLAIAIAERDHYKAEAYRNAQVGRDLDAAHRGTIASLESKLDAARLLQTASRRPLAHANA